MKTLIALTALAVLTGCAANLPQGDCPAPLVEHPTKEGACIEQGMAIDGPVIPLVALGAFGLATGAVVLP